MKKLISVILASVMLTGTAAGAIEIQDSWINLSAWAYNDVSNFTNEGLLPECFNGINDYRANITREQLAELIFQVFYSEFSSELDEYKNIHAFLDCSNPVITYLQEHHVLQGTTDKDLNIWFHPDEEITREDAATVIKRACGYAIPEHITQKFDDDAQITEYSKGAVYALSYAGIIKGIDSSNFAPKAHMSIEQAIVILMRLYYDMPQAGDVDGAGIKADTETLIKTYDNGFTETKLNNKLRIKNGENVLMEFETDIYSAVLCAENNGRNYILARNFKKRTEVYDAASKKLLYIIPYPVKKVENNYIYTVSTTTDAWFYGLYDFDGNEVLPAEYSEHEVRSLIANGFSFETELLPDLYYSISYSAEENGLYSYSNGKITKLSDAQAWYINILGDRLFYTDRYNDKLYSMKTDGTGVVEISRQPTFVLRYTGVDGREFLYFTELEFTDTSDENGDVFYAPFSTQPGAVPFLYRARFEDGELVKEKALDIPLYYVLLCEYDNMIYFKDYRAGKNSSFTPSSLYRYDGKDAVCIREDDVYSFSFSKSGIMLDPGTGNRFEVISHSDTDASVTEPVAADIPDRISPFGEPVDNEDDSVASLRNLFLNKQISDGDFLVYSNESETMVLTKAGKISAKLGKTGSICRYKDILYYFSDNNIYGYDMRSGKKQLLAENFDYSITQQGAGDVLYCRDKLGNLYTLDCNNGNMEHVYPNHSVSGNDDSAKVKNMLMDKIFFNKGCITDYCMADGSDNTAFWP